MSGNRWKASVLCFVGVLAITFYVWPKQPRYDGRSLTDWLLEYGDTDGVDAVRHGKAAYAIRQIGTNALPYLSRFATTPDSRFRELFWKVIPMEIALRLGIRGTGLNWALARDGFTALGPIAKPAVPKFVALLSDKNSDVRCNAAQSLGFIGPGAEEAVPGLIRHINDPDVYVQMCVRSALGQIHSQSGLVVPLLLESLKFPNPQHSEISSILALTNFPEASNLIVPVLVHMSMDSDPAIRAYVTNALQSFQSNLNTN